MTDAETSRLVEIAAPGGLAATVDLHGAQLWRLADADGTELLWPGDPRVWKGRAPILFPVVGSLCGGIYRCDGAGYALPRHGFARDRGFALVESGGASALLRLGADDETRRVYPFEFELDLRFTVSARALAVDVAVRNRGGRAMPFSFGFHPALRWPLEPGAGRGGHSLIFAAEEPAPVARLDAEGLVLPRREPSPVRGHRLDLRDELFADDALIFTSPASRSIEYGADDGQHGRRVTVAFANLPSLGLWSKPGAGYICIEPWQGMADPQGFAGDIFAKPGIVTLPPGAAWDAAMTLTIGP